ncbi:MAG: NUDIX hydrolase [Gemmatimonadetes bacterium]|jgi:8-oxo-dGTP pyrophosphatase MutT (NUDIX family)|nr:NUDIX hydrolase [Gemmatimonadota bacterium]
MTHRLKPVCQQSAVLPYRRHGSQLEVLLITSKGGKHWVLPKGTVASGMSPRESAEHKALEEAGISGYVYQSPIGEYSYRRHGSLRRVQVFLMRVEDAVEHWPEGQVRVRRWMTTPEAEQHVGEIPLRKIILDLQTLPGETHAAGREILTA